MTSHLRRDLQNIEKLLLFLAAKVESGLRDAMTALVERNRDLANQVVDRDEEIDRLEVELEEECLKILALHQPVATDLRFVAACIKIDNDLERIGDLVSKIARRSVSLAEMAPVELSHRLREMMEIGAEMLRDSLTAFVEEDADLARRVCQRDDEIDRRNRDLIHDQLARMEREPALISQALELVSISKALERIADHATNIAEDVVYLVEGHIIRHQ